MQELIGKKLKVVLKQLKEDGINVKVGAKNGTSFIFCGTASEFIAKSSTLELEYYNKAVNAVVNARKYLNRGIEAYLSPKDYIKTMYEESGGTDVGTYEHYIETLQRYFKKANNRKQRLTEVEDILENRTALLTRKVVDVYPSITEENTLILIIEGNEIGTFWDSEECKNGAEIDEDEEAEIEDGEGDPERSDRSISEPGGETQA